MKKIFRRETLTIAGAFLFILAAAVLSLLLTSLPEPFGYLPRLLTYAGVFCVMGRDISPVFKLSLCVPMLLFPDIGGAVWLASAEPFGKSAKASPAVTSPTELTGASAYLEARGFPVCRCSQAVYFSWGEQLFSAMLEKMKAAKRSIFIEFFIIAEGRALDMTVPVLAERASAGVDVRIMIDAAGSAYTKPVKFAEKLSELGIKLLEFSPPRFYDISGANRRDHRKIVTVDGSFAFCGGINLADEYFGMKERFGIWKDGGFMTDGETAAKLEEMFLSMWRSCGGESYPEASVPAVGDRLAQPFSDTPLDREPVSLNVYKLLICGAKKRLFITTPYLVCDDELIGGLCCAAGRGVDVKLILPGIPDKKYVNILTKSRYKRLIGAGAEVYEYSKGFVHSKNIVSDDTAAVGTVNLDYRSMALHYECGCLFFDKLFAEEVCADFNGLLSDCVRITALRQGFFTRIARVFLELLAPLF